MRTECLANDCSRPSLDPVLVSLEERHPRTSQLFLDCRGGDNHALLSLEILDSKKSPRSHPKNEVAYFAISSVPEWSLTHSEMIRRHQGIIGIDSEEYGFRGL